MKGGLMDICIEGAIIGEIIIDCILKGIIAREKRLQGLGLKLDEIEKGFEIDQQLCYENLDHCSVNKTVVEYLIDKGIKLKIKEATLNRLFQTMKRINGKIINHDRTFVLNERNKEMLEKLSNSNDDLEFGLTLLPNKDRKIYEVGPSFI